MHRLFIVFRRMLERISLGLVMVDPKLRFVCDMMSAARCTKATGLSLSTLPTGM
jgi:hypothetical protein